MKIKNWNEYNRINENIDLPNEMIDISKEKKDNNNCYVFTYRSGNIEDLLKINIDLINNDDSVHCNELATLMFISSFDDNVEVYTCFVPKNIKEGSEEFFNYLDSNKEFIPTNK